MRPDPTIRRAQLGVGLIDALAALLVFSLGMLGLVSLYGDAVVAPVSDQQVVKAHQQINALMAVLQSQPSQVPSASVSGVTSASGMPSFLQNWFQQTLGELPQLKVTLAVGNDGGGNSCSSNSCGVVVTLQWTQGIATRKKIVHGQIGFHS